MGEVWVLPSKNKRARRAFKVVKARPHLGVSVFMGEGADGIASVCGGSMFRSLSVKIARERSR